MLISDNKNKNLSIIYIDNKCGCKDGWIKWENIPLSDNGLCVTEEILLNFLEKYYDLNLKETFEWIK